jgi:hypothetical protein
MAGWRIDLPDRPIVTRYCYRINPVECPQGGGHIGQALWRTTARSGQNTALGRLPAEGCSIVSSIPRIHNQQPCVGSRPLGSEAFRFTCVGHLDEWHVVFEQAFSPKGHMHKGPRVPNGIQDLPICRHRIVWFG